MPEDLSVVLVVLVPNGASRAGVGAVVVNMVIHSGSWEFALRHLWLLAENLLSSGGRENVC